MKLVFAAPARDFLSFPTALLAHASDRHFFIKEVFARTSERLTSSPTALQYASQDHASSLITATRPQFLQLTFKDAALVAMVNLPMVRRAHARCVLDAIFPAFGKRDHVVDFTVWQTV